MICIHPALPESTIDDEMLDYRNESKQIYSYILSACLEDLPLGLINLVSGMCPRRVLPMLSQFGRVFYLQVYIYRSIQLCLGKLYGQPLTSLPDFQFVMGTCQTLKGIDWIVLASLSMSFGMAAYKLMHIASLPKVWERGKLLRLFSRQTTSQDATPMHSWLVDDVTLWLSHNIAKRDLKHTAAVFVDMKLDGPRLADVTEIQLVAFGVRAPVAALICDERSSTLHALSKMRRQPTMRDAMTLNCDKSGKSGQALSDADLFELFGARMKEDHARRHVQLPLFGRVRVPSVSTPRSLSRISRASRSSRGSRGKVDGAEMPALHSQRSARDQSHEPSQGRITFARSLHSFEEDMPLPDDAAEVAQSLGPLPRDKRRRMKEENMQFGVA